jgi:RNA polymerase sigma-70 factor (ECF subfamily)
MDLSDLKDCVERHHSESYVWALCCCSHNPTEAEEVLQIVYVKLLDGRARFRGESSFRTWLFSVIRKTAQEERRRALLRSMALLRLAAVTSAARTSHPDDTVYRSETGALFRKALSSLARRQREVIELVFYHELTLAEAAAVMGVSIGAARRHYDRAKKQFRRILEDLNCHDVEWRREDSARVIP